ncbi:hypothetical protein [Pseudooceanicola sp.]|uniref:hypothetical protein n=1 Tax=Pseudooceanicola sp. TaxID=1914328 RepID=UPI0035C67DC7
MTDKTDKGVETDPEAGRAKRPHRARRVLLWLAGGLLVPVLLLALSGLGLLWYAKGQTFVAPAWIKDRVETRIAGAISNVTIRFGDITLTVSDQWQPSLHLTDVQITPLGRGDPIALSDVTGSLDPAGLLDGQLRPRVISVTGTRLDFRRDEAGAYGVAFGTPSDLSGTAQVAGQEAGQLINALSELLDHPSFSSLRRVEGAALTVRYEDRRSGRAWTMDGGRLELTRNGDDLRLRGDFAVLGGHAYATTGELSIAGKMYSRATSLALRVEDAAARDIATQSAGLAWLGVLDAPISGALRVSTNEDGEIGPLHGTLQIGAGNLAPGETSDPVPFRSARTYFRYDPASLTLRFDELTVQSVWVEATAEGRIVLDGVSNGIPAAMTGQLRITELTANPAGIFQVPLYLERAEAEMRLNLDPFRLEVGRLDLRDRGQTLAIQGWFEAEPEGWDVSMTARTQSLTADDVLELWPATALPKTREWIARNVLEGTLRNLQLGVRSFPTTRPDVTLGFDFEDLITTFLPTMPPVEAASGHAELRGDRFVVTADDGWLYAPGGEGLQIAGTSFIYENTRMKDGPAQVLLRAAGALGDVLTLIDLEPLNLLSKAGRTPDMAQGRVDLSADLAFDLVKNLPVDKIAIAYRADLSDLTSDAIVPGQTLQAESLNITGTAQQITARGDAQLGTIPVGGKWQADLTPEGQGRSRFEGWLTVGADLGAQLNLGLPPDSIGGTGRANVEIDFARGTAPEFAATSNLSGISVRVPALNWTLSERETGRFDISGQLGTPPQIDRLSLSAPGVEVAGTIRLHPEGGGLDTARFSRVRMGTWLDAPVTLTGRGKSVAPRVAISGGRVDLRRMNLGEPNGKGGPVSLALDRLQVSEGIALHNMRGEFETRNGLNGSFTALLNGAAQIRGTVIPRNGGSALRATSEDAGRTLAATGLLNRGRGGTLDLTLTPVGPKGTYDGNLEVRDIWIQDAPAMASLLSALSIVGLLEQMSGNGILFTEANADFRLTPSQLILRGASAVGASMGVSMDGIYDFDGKRMDMQGVVSPLYVINGIGRLFSRNDGEGLIGFNYRLIGAVANPRVQVNPLSLFTPGMFREIFRRPPPRTN